MGQWGSSRISVSHWSNARPEPKTPPPFFPGTARNVLERSIERYKAQGTWASDPLIREDGFTAMHNILIDGGVVKGRHSYNRLVRPEFAVEAMKESSRD